MPTLFPIGYRCVWEASDGQSSVDFTNWPLTIAVVAGFALIALGGWRLSRSRISRPEPMVSDACGRDYWKSRESRTPNG